VATSAVFIDLDRTLLCQASGQVLSRAMAEEGVLPKGRSLPGDRLLYAVNDRLGENLFSMGLVRAAARVANRNQHPRNHVRDFHDWKNQHAQQHGDNAGGCQIPAVA
jgi:hypothetical protein